MLKNSDYKIVLKKEEDTKKLIRYVRSLSVSPEEINSTLEKKGTSKIKQKVKAHSVISRPGILIDDIVATSEKLKAYINDQKLKDSCLEQVEIDIKYSGYIKREKENASKLKRLEYVKIPKDINYFKFSSLSNEAKEKLNEIRPVDIGQASRISGIKPSDISILLIYLGR